ncbi:MAG: hypothetical protein ACPGUD_04730 [Parashewanella sp.]
MQLINDTARQVNVSIAETIWISAHNKQSNQWEQRNWGDWTWTRLSVDYTPIAISANQYDKIIIHGFAGTWDSDELPVITCRTNECDNPKQVDKYFDVRDLCIQDNRSEYSTHHIIFIAEQFSNSSNHPSEWYRDRTHYVPCKSNNDPKPPSPY